MSSEKHYDIDLEAVEKAGKLARIQLSDEEAKQFQEQISAALASFEKINEIDIDGVEPLVSPLDQPIQSRKDEVEVHSEIDDIIEQAPDVQGNLFRVPPVV